MRLNESKKQYRRLGALKYSVINDIGMITESNEVDLLKEVIIKNLIGNLVGTVKKVTNENAFIEIDGQTHQVDLSDIDADSILKILNQLELDLMDRYYNYPDCCRQFFGKNRESHDVNWGGFIPCMEHKDLSLEEITELLGRNPITDDNLPSVREPESETVIEESYKNYNLDIEDNHDGTFHWIRRNDGEILEDEFHRSSSLDSQYFFSEKEALEKGKEFIDSLTD